MKPETSKQILQNLANIRDAKARIQDLLEVEVAPLAEKLMREALVHYRDKPEYKGLSLSISQHSVNLSKEEEYIHPHNGSPFNATEVIYHLPEHLQDIKNSIDKILKKHKGYEFSYHLSEKDFEFVLRKK